MGETDLILRLAGTVTDGVGPANPWTGDFSAIIPNQTPATLQAIILGGGTVTTSNSGTFAATSASVPEPSSVILLVGALGFLIRKMHRKRFLRRNGGGILGQH
jgi:hypothetical protein